MDEMDEDAGTGSSPALRWGLTLGIVLTVLGILDQAVVTILARQSHAQQLGATTLAPLSVTLICLLPMLAFVLTFGMGILAGREAGAVGAAALAGLFGVVIYTVITTITGLVMNTTASVWSLLFATTPEFSQAGAGPVILSTTCDLIIYGLIGMGVASLGGLIGRALSPDDEADQPPYPAYAGWDPSYGPPPAYPPPAYPPPAYPPPAYPPPPGYGPPPDGGRSATEPPPPAPDARRQ